MGVPQFLPHVLKVLNVSSQDWTSQREDWGNPLLSVERFTLAANIGVVQGNHLFPVSPLW